MSMGEAYIAKYDLLQALKGQPLTALGIQCSCNDLIVRRCKSLWSQFCRWKANWVSGAVLPVFEAAEFKAVAGAKCTFSATELLSVANMLFVSTNVCSCKTVLANILFAATNLCSNKTAFSSKHAVCIYIHLQPQECTFSCKQLRLTFATQNCFQLQVVGGGWRDGGGASGWMGGWWVVGVPVRPSPLVHKVLSNANFKICVRIITEHVACFCTS